MFCSDGQVIVLVTAGDGLFLVDLTGRPLAGSRSVLRRSFRIIALGLGAGKVPVENADVSRHSLNTLAVRVGAKRLLTGNVDQTTLLDASLLDPIGNILIAGTVVEGGILLRAQLLVHDQTKGAVLSVLTCLELRIIDHAPLHVDFSVHLSVFLSAFRRKLFQTSIDVRYNTDPAEAGKRKKQTRTENICTALLPIMPTKLAVSSHLKKLRLEDQSNKYTVSIASLNLRIHYT